MTEPFVIIAGTTAVSVSERHSDNRSQIFYSLYKMARTVEMVRKYGI